MITTRTFNVVEHSQPERVSHLTFTVQNDALPLSELVRRSLQGASVRQHPVSYSNSENFEDVSLNSKPALDFADVHEQLIQIDDELRRTKEEEERLLKEQQRQATET